MAEEATGRDMLRWGDAAMFRSEPMPEETRAANGGARPAVTILNATPDPLGEIASIDAIYTGRVVRRLADVTDEQRRTSYTEMTRTVLQGPLEAVQFHFLVEGVTRAFTHQAVRSRFSFFAQESLRFAVVDGEEWVNRQAYPPSLAARPVSVDDIMGGHILTPEERDYALRRDAWDDAITAVQNAYDALIDAGVPAEDARGLMPHSITTRYHWIVSLRTLLGEAGKRLCTQAQFEWRLVMAEVAKAIREWGEDRGAGSYSTSGDGWQFEFIADQLRPLCYQEGHCGFMSKFDRGCTIRPRVEANAAIGRPSSEWHEPVWLNEGSPTIPHAHQIAAIRPQEWLTDPNAARGRVEEK